MCSTKFSGMRPGVAENGNQHRPHQSGHSGKLCAWVRLEKDSKDVSGLWGGSGQGNSSHSFLRKQKEFPARGPVLLAVERRTHVLAGTCGGSPLCERFHMERYRSLHIGFLRHSNSSAKRDTYYLPLHLKNLYFNFGWACYNSFRRGKRMIT